MTAFCEIIKSDGVVKSLICGVALHLELFTLPYA
jgi:hypothetical protein